ncbi:hypothetical protein [uncultured Ruminococcus sp.]|uniref:hypothetical protein n=1 Tax=uncultured Ruminococcus sp. TaxID=165186 RepID=UPI003459E5F4
MVIPLTHHKNSGYTELKVLGVWRSIILLFTAFYNILHNTKNNKRSAVFSTDTSITADAATIDQK